MASPIHHVGYVVPELPTGVQQFAERFGAGPFFAMEHMVFDEVTFEGAPALYDHSSAFGAWGPILVELSEVHAARPEGLRRRLTAPGGGIGHVAWLADSLVRETERLTGLGFTPFHTGRTGPASAVWFDGGEPFGHPVEVLERCEPILSFYALVRDAAREWDGADPFRVMTRPPE